MTDSAFSVCVVIPVYNHERAIGAVVDSIRPQALPIILVDDGSSPECAQELQRLSELSGVSLIRLPRNCGKGVAVCSGLRAARERGYTHAIQVDADGQHTLSDMRRFVEAARERRDHVICGQPVFDASIPKARYYGRYLTHALVWLETLSFDIVDSMCGFRLYPLAACGDLIEPHHVGSRMDFDTEMIVRLHWREVPLHWIQTRVSYPLDGVSHFRMFFDNVRMTSLHVRLVLGMLARLPVLLWRKSVRRTDPETHKHNANA